MSLHYDIAGIGSRSAAALIDTAIQSVLYIGLAALTFGSGLLLHVFPVTQAGMVNTVFLITTLGTFLLLWGYYLLFELAWSGQTPGKRILGIRVIRENGYPMRAWDAVVRNVVRIIDAPPFGAVIGLLVMLLNGRAKRLGDFAAGTIVVREGRVQSPSSLALGHAASAEPGQQAGARPLSLRPQDATLVRDFLARRQAMNTQARASLAHRLAASLAQSYGLQMPPSMTDEAFLESLSDT